jgi:hypothetical protein
MGNDYVIQQPLIPDHMRRSEMGDWLVLALLIIYKAVVWIGNLITFYYIVLAAFGFAYYALMLTMLHSIQAPVSRITDLYFVTP